MSYFPSCCPVGSGSSGTHTIINVGGAAEWYVIGTGPNPFELRTAESSDASITVTQNALTVDFVVDFANNVTLANVGGFAEVWVDPSGPNPFDLRTFQSSDASVNITQNALDLDFTVPQVSGAEVFQVDSTASLSTTSTTYQTVTTLATDPRTQIKDTEEWKINMCLFVCHPVNVFTVNTFVRWQIETAAGVFTTFDEWQINAPIVIQQGEPSIPFHRTKKLTVSFDDPRMRVQIRMSAVQASATFVEDPRWGGVQIAPAP